MKKIKKWQIALVAILAILIVSRIITGKPIAPTIVEIVRNIDFSALLRALTTVLTRELMVDLGIVIVGLLPAMMALAYQAESQTVNWRTRTGNLRWRQVQRLQKKCRDKYSAPAFAIAVAILIVRQDVFCLAFLIIGAILVWVIDSGKIKLKKEK